MSSARSTRPPLPVRIATWRRRIVVGSLGMFVAAWLAVAGLGRQAASSADTGTTAASGSTTKQAQSTDSQTESSGSDPSYGADSTQSDSTQSDSTQSSSSQDDLSAPSTRQS
jgi:hypothetical protein